MTDTTAPLKKQWLPIRHVGIVIVAYKNQAKIGQLLESIGKDKHKLDFLLVIDNDPEHKSADVAEAIPFVDKVIRSTNIGFSKACNLSVRQMPKRIDSIFLLNPDTKLKKGTLEYLRQNFPNNWAACMPLLVMGRNKVNSAGNVLHMSGLSWCGDFNQPANNFHINREILFISGACTFIRRSVWDEIGGYYENYFLYYEDTELSLRLLTKGYVIGLLPNAHVQHSYIFEKGNFKWFYIERNRYLLIARNFPLAVILALSPFLIISELGLWVISVIRGRFRVRVRAVFSFLKMFPSVLKDRRRIQNESNLSALEFYNFLSAKADSPFVGAVIKFNPLLRIYYATTRFLLIGLTWIIKLPARLVADSGSNR